MTVTAQNSGKPRKSGRTGRRRQRATGKTRARTWTSSRLRRRRSSPASSRRSRTRHTVHSIRHGSSGSWAIRSDGRISAPTRLTKAQELAAKRARARFEFELATGSAADVVAAGQALAGFDCGADYCVDPGNCAKHDEVDPKALVIAVIADFQHARARALGLVDAALDILGAPNPTPAALLVAESKLREAAHAAHWAAVPFDDEPEAPRRPKALNEYGKESAITEEDLLRGYGLIRGGPGTKGDTE
jgi:hypothetical protein